LVDRASSRDEPVLVSLLVLLQSEWIAQSLRIQSHGVAGYFPVTATGAQAVVRGRTRIWAGAVSLERQLLPIFWLPHCCTQSAFFIPFAKRARRTLAKQSGLRCCSPLLAKAGSNLL